MKGFSIKTIIYIDGQNFLYRAAEYIIAAGLASNKQDIHAIDLPFLFNQFTSTKDLEIRYYSVANIRRQDHYGPEIYEKSVLFADNLRRLRSYLTKTGVIFKPAGTLKVRERDICKTCGTADYKLQEKGVDVGLAVDLVTDAFQGEVDHIILVSSDTDLIPALRIVKAINKTLTYVSFPDQQTLAIARLADTVEIISNEKIIEAYRRTFDIAS